jgi:asparagine synthase (glutamine-hydrolysing)
VLDGTALLDGRLVRRGDLESMLPSYRTEMHGLLARLDGFFRMLWRDGDRVVAVVDRVRSLPMFFAERGDSLEVGDDPFEVRRVMGNGTAEPKPEVAAEFLLSGFVTGEETLDPRIRQLPAGTFLWAERRGIGWTCEINRYWEFRSSLDEQVGLDAARWEDRLDRAATAAISRLIRVADGRPIVVPLSGGRDSRLIVLKLKELGYPDLSCYSYGSPGNPESISSRRVAERLDVPWHFVAYTPEVWRRTRTDPAFERFRRRAHALSQIECIQEWPAVDALRDTLPPTAMIVPGHTLDFVAGSNLPVGRRRAALSDERDVENEILRRHLSLWRRRVLGEVFGSDAPAVWDGVRERIAVAVRRFDTVDSCGQLQAIEYFGWRERQAKFIVNSVRAYEAHGFQWWLPWWDRGFVDLWTSVPQWLRVGKRLRDAYVDSYQRRFGIDDLQAISSSINVRSGWGALALDAIRYRTMGPLRRVVDGRIRWQVPSQHPMRWYALIEPEMSSWGYSGVETVNAYLSRRYVGR